MSEVMNLRRWLEEAIDEDEDDGEASVVSQVLSYTFLFFLIFGLSATVDMKNMKKQLKNKFAISLGVAMQFFIMPVLGAMAVWAFKNNGFTEPIGIILLVVTSSPGGSYSNWWCSTFNADLALSVAMTTVSSLMSIGMLPANLMLYSWLVYGQSEEESIVQALDFGSLFISLGIVMAAIVLGLASGYKWDTKTFHVWANRMGSVSGLGLILFGVFLSGGGGGSDTNMLNMDWTFYVGVAFPCLVGIALANVLSRAARLSPPETVAISIECCYQNTGIATSVAITMFNDADERAQAVAVPLFYGVVEAVVIAFYCVWAWKMGMTKAPADEKFCVVVSKTYEIEDEEENDDADHSNVEVHVDENGEIVVTEGERAPIDPTKLKKEDSNLEQSDDNVGMLDRLRRYFGKQESTPPMSDEGSIDLPRDRTTSVDRTTNATLESPQKSVGSIEGSLEA